MFSAIIGAIGSVATALIGGSKTKKVKTSQAISNLQNQLNQNILTDVEQEKKIKFLIFGVAGLFIILIFFIIRK